MQIPDLSNRYKRRENYVKNNFEEFYNYIIVNFSFCNSFPEKLYCYVHNIKEKQKCKICDNYVKFINFTKGYLLHCSYECAHKDKDTLKLQSEAIIKKWSCERELILNKRKKHLLKTLWCYKWWRF